MERNGNGYSRDGGIDAFLQKDGQTVGVQVKRFRSSIKVEQIRSLAGALLSKGLTKGIFVTTSSFQRGAQPEADHLATKGYAIQLMDSARLFDALKIAQRQKYRSGRDFPKELLDDLPLIGGRTFDPYRRTERRLVDPIRLEVAQDRPTLIGICYQGFSALQDQ